MAGTLPPRPTAALRPGSATGPAPAPARGRPRAVMPVTVISGEPIMKSMWIWLSFERSRSSSGIRNGKPWPSARWLAAFSSISVS